MKGIISNPISPNELHSSTVNFIVVLFVYGVLIGILETTGQSPQIYNTEWPWRHMSAPGP